jgi:hypothetical protein
MASRKKDKVKAAEAPPFMTIEAPEIIPETASEIAPEITPDIAVNAASLKNCHCAS